MLVRPFRCIYPYHVRYRGNAELYDGHTGTSGGRFRAETKIDFDQPRQVWARSGALSVRFGQVWFSAPPICQPRTQISEKGLDSVLFLEARVIGAVTDRDFGFR